LWDSIYTCGGSAVGLELSMVRSGVGRAPLDLERIFRRTSKGSLVAVVSSTPEWHRTRPGAGPSAVVIMLITCATAVVIGHRTYRTIEVVVAGRILDLVTSYGVVVTPGRQTVYFGLGSGSPFGLRMSPECTSAFLLVPLFGLAALMIALRPWITRSVLTALGVAGLVLLVVNQLRILTLVGLINWLGTKRGYHLGHTVLGSMVSVIGGAAALILFVLLATRPARRPSARPPLRRP
jgi:exosortase/archaeosortase family protein